MFWPNLKSCISMFLKESVGVRAAVVLVYDEEAHGGQKQGLNISPDLKNKNQDFASFRKVHLNLLMQYW